MNYNPFSLKGKTILITGASSGIGRATAIECSKIGATCIITGRNQERLEETYRELEGEGHNKIVADLTTEEGLQLITAQVMELNGIVFNAGIGKTKPIQFIKEDDLNAVMITNAFAPALLLKALIKTKKITHGASVVFTASIGGVKVFAPGSSAYGMSKAALTSFMKYAAIELASKSIRCNSVHPGMVETPMNNPDTLTKDDYEKDRQKYPLKRYGKPEDVAYGIIYLLSDASSWVTGTTLVIDGGVSI
jgi:NAD(P)-dependent dehydrogenase (short-subunit alcohol dehydrogenase family)